MRILSVTLPKFWSFSVNSAIPCCSETLKILLTLNCQLPSGADWFGVLMKLMRKNLRARSCFEE